MRGCFINHKKNLKQMNIKIHITEKGFTLIEIMTTLVIISVLVGLALPRYLIMVEKFRAKEGEQVLIALYGAQKRFSLENAGTYANALDDLDIEPRSSPYFNALTDADISSSPLAQTTRTGSYTLSINNAGIIACSGGATGLCTKIGY